MVRTICHSTNIHGTLTMTMSRVTVIPQFYK